MTAHDLKPSMYFTPARPARRESKEQCVPLARIDRRLFPAMRVHAAPPPRGKSSALPTLAKSGVSDATATAAGAAAHVDPISPAPSLRSSLAPPLPSSHAREPVNSAASELDCSLASPLPGSSAILSADSPAGPPQRKKRGRPEVIVGPRRQQLLHILRRGQSRRLASERVGIDPATLARAIRRDERLQREVAAAEQEGDKFLAIYDKLHNGRDVVLEHYPVISTPELEREKEYLIACGLPAERIRRLRMRTLADGPPRGLTRAEKQRINRDIKVRPWRKRK